MLLADVKQAVDVVWGNSLAVACVECEGMSSTVVVQDWYSK